ncbi:hypothetical protein BDB00DRAFT_832834, partial [Zychaea mexicana]|uniref:uncharacterized protein n=1 Tax=Zychaea mexicana TaxID=64656 RepID=UPI0022FE73B1
MVERLSLRSFLVCACVLCLCLCRASMSIVDPGLFPSCCVVFQGGLGPPFAQKKGPFGDLTKKEEQEERKREAGTAKETQNKGA